jgi:hypothetical protein
MAGMLFRFLVLIAAVLGGMPLATASDKDAAGKGRVALVIGNAGYKNAKELRNPVNDAEDMAAALKRLGFQVIFKRNASLIQMKNAVREFGQKLHGAEAGLFFYAGHGLQVRGQNFLVPVDAQIETEADAEDASLRLDYVVQTMDDGGATLNVLVLDACRDNPFARSFRSLSRGLAQLQAGSGTLIEYSTAPGSVAGDGDGRNGLYTKHLLKSLADDDSDIQHVFQRARARVVEETAGKQTPWESSSMVGEFSFKPGAARAAAPARAADAPAETAPDAIHVQSADEVEQSFWNRVKDSTDAGDFADYSKQFPHGPHSAEASLMARKLASAPLASRKNLSAANSIALAQPSAGSGAASILPLSAGGPYKCAEPVCQKVLFDLAMKDITADPSNADHYFELAQGMCPKINLVLIGRPLNGPLDCPDGTADALGKNLELAPNGQFAKLARQCLALMSTQGPSPVASVAPTPGPMTSAVLQGPAGPFPGYITSSLQPGQTINGTISFTQGGAFEYQGSNGVRLTGRINLSNPDNVTGHGTTFLPKMLGLIQSTYPDGKSSARVTLHGRIVDQTVQGQFSDRYETGQFVFNLAPPN